MLRYLFAWCRQCWECFVFLDVTQTVLIYCALLICKGRREDPELHVHRVICIKWYFQWSQYQCVAKLFCTSLTYITCIRSVEGNEIWFCVLKCFAELICLFWVLKLVISMDIALITNNITPITIGLAPGLEMSSRHLGDCLGCNKTGLIKGLRYRACFPRLLDYPWLDSYGQ